MTACDYSAAVRIVAADGVTVRGDLNGRAAGYTVEMFQEPDESPREVTVESEGYVDGDYAVATSDGPGTLVVLVRVAGSSWVEVESRWQTARGWYRAEPVFYLETAVEGVTKRWECRRPRVESGPTESVNLARKRQTFTLRFPVQPNPTVTV